MSAWDDAPVRPGRIISTVLLVALVAACSSGGAKGSRTTVGVGAATVHPADCGLAELAAAKGPVEVTFWHVQTEADNTNIATLAAKFNASQSKVHVNLVQQATYADEMQKWQAGLTTGDLPDSAQMQETNVQQLMDSKSTVPVAACVEADHFDLSDFTRKPIDYYTVDGVLQALAWNVSNIAFFYNRVDFTKAGLDPNAPPKTLDELRTAAQQIVDRKVAPHGMSMRIAPDFFEYWFAKADKSWLDHGNGRTGRATKVELLNDTGRTLWKWWKDMVDSGLVLNVGSDPTTIDHFLAIGNHQASMTIEGNAGLARINAALNSGIWKGVQSGISPLPGIAAGGGVPIGDGSLWIAKSASPVRRAASWQWMKFLVSTESQIWWMEQKGAAPTRQSVADDPGVKQFWAQHPEYRVGWDQVQAGPVDDASAGARLGPFQAVRNAIREDFALFLRGGMTVDDGLRRAEYDANAAIADYNRRVG